MPSSRGEEPSCDHSSTCDNRDWRRTIIHRLHNRNECDNLQHLPFISFHHPPCSVHVWGSYHQVEDRGAQTDGGVRGYITGGPRFEGCSQCKSHLFTPEGLLPELQSKEVWSRDLRGATLYKEELPLKPEVPLEMDLLWEKMAEIQGMFSRFLNVAMTRDPTLVLQTSQDLRYILDADQKLSPLGTNNPASNMATMTTSQNPPVTQPTCTTSTATARLAYGSGATTTCV